MRSTMAFLLLLLLAGCRGNMTRSGETAGDTLAMKYAQNITIVSFPGYTKVSLTDPWKHGQVLHEYLLADSLHLDSLRHSSANDGRATLVRVPLCRSVVFNTAHASLIGMLHATKDIVGVADLEYMQLPEIHRLVGEDIIADCGNSMSPDVERIIDLRADAVLLSPFENNGGYGRLEEIGVPIIECAEYMETSALGRAEWMRFYGLLFGCRTESDSLFAEVERQYLSISDQARRSLPRRSIMTEKLTGSTWYVAGGKSTVSQLIADAGGDYPWAEDDHSGSLPLTFEQVLDHAGETDVWVFNDLAPQPLTYEQLAAEFHGYSQLRAFREKQVWYVNSLRVPYFEEVSFRPDFLLADYVRILHPELHVPGGMRYFRQVISNVK